jgi:hypothetical protein
MSKINAEALVEERVPLSFFDKRNKSCIRYLQPHDGHSCAECPINKLSYKAGYAEGIAQFIKEVGIKRVATKSNCYNVALWNNDIYNERKKLEVILS